MGAMAGLVDRFNESVRRHDATFNADLLSDDVKLYGGVRIASRPPS